MRGLQTAILTFLFQLEPETVHRLVIRVMGILQSVLEATGSRLPLSDALLRQELFGQTFSNPIGLAAGLDKNGELPHVWPARRCDIAGLIAANTTIQRPCLSPSHPRAAESGGLSGVRDLLVRDGFESIQDAVGREA